MAVAFVMDFAGATLAQYDQVMEKMDLEGDLPPHALFHAVGQTDDGLRVVDVWEDDASYEQFAETQIGRTRPRSASRRPPSSGSRSPTSSRATASAPALVQLLGSPASAASSSPRSTAKSALTGRRPTR